MAAHAGAREKSKGRANDWGGWDRPCNTRRGASSGETRDRPCNTRRGASSGTTRDRPCNTRRDAGRRSEKSVARGGAIRSGLAQEFTSCTVFAHFALAFKGGLR